MQSRHRTPRLLLERARRVRADPGQSDMTERVVDDDDDNDEFILRFQNTLMQSIFSHLLHACLDIGLGVWVQTAHCTLILEEHKSKSSK